MQITLYIPGITAFFVIQEVCYIPVSQLMTIPFLSM